MKAATGSEDVVLVHWEGLNGMKNALEQACIVLEDAPATLTRDPSNSPVYRGEGPRTPGWSLTGWFN